MKPSLALVIVLGLAPLASAAPVAWPADNAWTPATIGAAPYVDRLTVGGNLNDDYYNTPPSPEYTDIVGGTDAAAQGVFAAGFWSNNGTDVMFRIRVDAVPLVNPQTVWQVLLNLDADSDAEYALQLDLSSADNQVELVQALSGGPDNGWNVVLAGPPHTNAADRADYSRYVNASTGAANPPYTGSHFDSLAPADDDYFVDIAFPWADFKSVTGVGDGFDFADNIAFSTSASHTLTNKDLPDIASWDNPQGPDPHDLAIPEPLTLMALACALAGVGGYARRRTGLRSS